MVFELMSNGSIVTLPQTALPRGIPDITGSRVVLLLPYNRYLLGHCFLNNYERWIWGKPGVEPREIFLYEDGFQLFLSDESFKITLSSAVVENLRSALFLQMPPPGEHLPAVLILRGVMKDHLAFKDESTLHDQVLFGQYMEKDGLLNMAYWAIRFALFRGEFEAVSRVKAWLRNAGDLLESMNSTPPRAWFSLTPLPGARELAEMESLAFSLDDLQRMNSQSTLPVVLFSKSGYLVLSDVGSAESSVFRVWAFLPTPLWNELRERRKLSIRDLVLSVWGYWDAVQTLTELSRYARASEGLISTLS